MSKINPILLLASIHALSASQLPETLMADLKDSVPHGIPNSKIRKTGAAKDKREAKKRRRKK